MWKDACIVAGDNGALHLDGVNKGQGVGDLFEHAAHEVKVKPNTREPSREVGEERAANAAHLLVVENASAKEPERDIEQRNGDEENEREQDVNGNVQAQYDGKEVGRNALGKRDGDERQGVTENEIHRRHGRGVKAVHKAALSVFCNNGGREQRHKGKTEHCNSGREVCNLKQAHGDVCLNGAQKQKQNNGEAEQERKV